MNTAMKTIFALLSLKHEIASLEAALIYLNGVEEKGLTDEIHRALGDARFRAGLLASQAKDISDMFNFTHKERSYLNSSSE